MCDFPLLFFQFKQPDDIGCIHRYPQLGCSYGPRGSNTICAEDGKVTAHMERSMRAIASQGVSGHGWHFPGAKPPKGFIQEH